MIIPFVDLKMQYNAIKESVDNAMREVIESSTFIKGKYVEKFENNFAKYCGASYCIGVGNGTDALFLSLRALGIGKGHEVIVPANTFIATAEAVSLTGAKVVFVDCDPKTYNIDVHLLENHINEKTKCIIPVHLYGQPAEMKKIKDLAAKYGLKIVQDCAQAHGAKYFGHNLSEFGDILCYSFYPGKNLGAYGDAGGIVTNNDQLAKTARMLANHGRTDKYDHEFEGVNSRMDGMQGNILDVKLMHLDSWNRMRRRNAVLYKEALSDVPGLVLPFESENIEHVYHLFVIKAKRRDQLQQYLKSKDISVGIHYPVALPFLKAYAHLGHEFKDFPVSAHNQNEILSLPMFPELNETQIAYVAEQIKGFYKK